MSNAAFTTANKAFISKPSFVGTKAAAAVNGGQSQRRSNEAGIILNNVKSGGGGTIRQIKDMGSNPGSRVGSHKANARAGDQTTIIKKQYI